VYQSIYPGKVIDSGITLLKITENGKTGNRLITANPGNHGDIGYFANDFSTQLYQSSKGAVGDFSTAFGKNTIARNEDSFVLGRHNIGLLDTIFEIGIGLNDSAPKNGLEIYTDGRIRATELTIALHDDPRSLVTKEYVDLYSGGGGNLYSDGSVLMDTGYIPTADLSIATKEYIDSKPVVATLDDLTNVTVPNPTSGQILKFDGTNWVAATDEVGDILPDTIVYSNTNQGGVDTQKIENIVQITETAYNNLSTPDPLTVYIVI